MFGMVINDDGCVNLLALVMRLGYELGLVIIDY